MGIIQYECTEKQHESPKNDRHRFISGTLPRFLLYPVKFLTSLFLKKSDTLVLF